MFQKNIINFCVGKVLKSKDDKWKEGDTFYGTLPWSKKQVLDSKYIGTKIPPDLSNYKPKDDEKDDKFDVSQIGSKIPLSYYVGCYGMPGRTAYYGLIVKGEIKEKECVLISGAAGAVGSLVGQIAKNIYNCYVVGICGSDAKCKFLTEELGFDGAINYKKFGDNYNDIQAELKSKFEKGIDLYYDNVGGIFTEAMWDVLKFRARVIVCGQIAHYNDDPDKPSMVRASLGKLISKEIVVKGMDNQHFTDQDKFYYDMGKWIISGKIKIKETIIDGFENTAQAFCDLFDGKNIGKMVVKCT